MMRVRHITAAWVATAVLLGGPSMALEMAATPCEDCGVPAYSSAAAAMVIEASSSHSEFSYLK